MTSRNEILSRTEDIDKAVRDFSEALKRFSDETSGQTEKMKIAVQSAGSGWEGETYDSFVSMMDEELASVKKVIVHADDISSKLDGMAEKISQALALLRQGGN